MDINIPTGPLDIAPFDAIRNQPGEGQTARREALARALGGVHLGSYDRQIINWLADWDNPTVATIASLLTRARAAEIKGRIVLDEPTELGLIYDTGEDLLTLEPPFVVIHTGGADELVIPTAVEAREWAAQIAAMANAQESAGGAL